MFDRNHNSQIDDFEIVAGQYHTDDVFANVVDIPFNGGEQNLSASFRNAGFFFFSFDKRHEIGNRFLHHPRTFDDLRQEHLSGAKQIADDIHAVHERTFDHCD